MFESIESYLAALKSALKDADPALVQDALWDAEAHLNSGLAAQREQHPEIPEAKALAGLQATFGTPEEVAEAYLEREAVVAQALHPKGTPTAAESEAPLAPWPGFFEVLKTPKAYTSLLYLVMSLATGIFFFTWAVTGLSLSLGLFIQLLPSGSRLGRRGMRTSSRASTRRPSTSASIRTEPRKARVKGMPMMRTKRLKERLRPVTAQVKKKMPVARDITR